MVPLLLKKIVNMHLSWLTKRPSGHVLAPSSVPYVPEYKTRSFCNLSSESIDFPYNCTQSLHML